MSSSEPLIAIVDDDDSVRESLRALIRSAGFAAVTFSSAEEFLQAEADRATRCLVLDVRMPGMGGLELQRRLRLQARDIPIVFITAHADDELRALALREGAIDVLPKPFRDESLLDAIHAGLESRVKGAE